MNAQLETLKRVMAGTRDERARINLAREVALALRNQKHAISESAFCRVKFRGKAYPSQVVARALNEASARNANLYPIDSSLEMREAYKGPGALIVSDAEKYNYKPFSFAVLNLTLQFIEPNEREGLLEKLKAQVIPGGAILVVDKTEPLEGYLGLAFYRLTLAGKLASGIAPEDIIAKEMSLGGVQRPLDRKLLRDFTQYFQFGDFAGFIYERR